MSTITKPQTSATGAPSTPSCPQESPELYRFRVDQYEQMGRAGILAEDDRVELVEGVLYRKPMKKGTHSIAARETAAASLRSFRQSPISSPAKIRFASPAAPACPSRMSPWCVANPETTQSSPKRATSHSW